METKMVRIPFDIELAERITDGNEEGRVVTRIGSKARIICWDANSDNPIVALISADDNGKELLKSYTKDGVRPLKGESPADLFLEVPEYNTFKDGDVLCTHTQDKWVFMYKQGGYAYTSFYCALNTKVPKKICFDSIIAGCCPNEINKATEEEKHTLIDVLKENKDPRAKECLKMLGIEERKEYTFKPFERVLVRDEDEQKWICDFFSYQAVESDYPFSCVVGAYKQCIPYEGNEALLRTTDSPKS